MHTPWRRGSLWVPALAVLVACSSPSLKHAPARDGGGDPADRPSLGQGAADADDEASNHDGANAADAPVADGPGQEAPGLIERCVVGTPGAFGGRCSACHTVVGPTNPRYPDLYAFTGTAAEFLSVVRNGKGTMPAFPPTTISDRDVQAAFELFGGGKRPSLDAIDLGGVAPLFARGDAVAPPVVTTRADGSILTRGAGRMHGRHEREESFGTYLVGYWSALSYGFAIEDFSLSATPHIRVTYLPNYEPAKTWWMAWKEPGDNAVFLNNEYLATVDAALVPVVPPPTAGGLQQFDQTKIPQGRSMAPGQTFEFEVDKSTVSGSEALSYSDTFRYLIGEGGLTPENRDLPRTPGPMPDARLGGDTTLTWLFAEPYMYFDQMALDIQVENVQAFLEGRRLFNVDFMSGANVEPLPPAARVTAQPPFPEQAGKAGPSFDATACATCHVRNGAGATLMGPLGSLSTMVFRLPGAAAPANQLHPQEGAAAPAGVASKTVVLGDGVEVVLQKPTFTVTSGGAAVPFSARVARPLVGLGLLEAIDERALLTRADRQDCDDDGVSGRVNLVKDPVTGALRVGRFGWKAEKVSVLHQVADDAAASLGVGTSVIKDATGQAELSDDDLARLTTYMRLVGVPPQRNGDDPQVRQGEALFMRAGCAVCHVTDALTSPNHPFAELRGQAVKPYTDLLLHDMGADLADDSAVPASNDPLAPPAASEWRTPPLWGIGLRQTVNGNTGLLHDGRAADVEEAILWHGGEASRAAFSYTAMSADQRAALIAFVGSL
jgi:CxxC motif-containing protein (DUF1111 family)